jgi:hypothetical protein
MHMRGSDEIFISGTRFISASLAAKEFGFVRDHVARLCRQGLVLGQRVDSNWYVDPESLRQFVSKREEDQKRRNEELRRAFRTEPAEPDPALEQENIAAPRSHALAVAPQELIAHARKKQSTDRRAHMIEYSGLLLVLAIAFATSYAIFNPTFTQKIGHDIAAASASVAA